MVPPPCEKNYMIILDNKIYITINTLTRTRISTFMSISSSTSSSFSSSHSLGIVAYFQKFVDEATKKEVSKFDL